MTSIQDGCVRVPVLPLSSGASWPRIDPQMLPWWGGRGQSRRGARGSCWISLPQNANGTGRRKEAGAGILLSLRDGLIRLSAKRTWLLCIDMVPHTHTHTELTAEPRNDWTCQDQFWHSHTTMPHTHTHTPPRAHTYARFVFSGQFQEQLVRPCHQG